LRGLMRNLAAPTRMFSHALQPRCWPEPPRIFVAAPPASLEVVAGRANRRRFGHPAIPSAYALCARDHRRRTCLLGAELEPATGSTRSTAIRGAVRLDCERLLPSRHRRVVHDVGARLETPAAIGGAHVDVVVV